MDEIDAFQAQAEENLEFYKPKIKALIEKYYHDEYDFEYRIKTRASIERKQNLNSRIKLYQIPDILGFRISVPNDEYVLIISKIMARMEPITFTDFFNTPRNSGFKAFIYRFGSFEIQIMTYQMRDWTNNTHDEYEKQRYGIKK